MLTLNKPDERVAAILHDVVEDTNVTLDDLRAAGFSEKVLAAIHALTKTTGETRLAAASRAAADPVARAVKLADVADNMNMSRIAQPTDRDYARLKVYEQVRCILLAEGRHQTPL
jgi:guanosine-3',5'-bis(diphosphate) 3'-pyrophosphohydrolase